LHSDAQVSNNQSENKVKKGVKLLYLFYRDSLSFIVFAWALNKWAYGLYGLYLFTKYHVFCVGYIFNHLM